MKWIVPHPVPPHNGLTLSGRPKEREIKAKTLKKKKKDKPNQTKTTYLFIWDIQGC